MNALGIPGLDKLCNNPIHSSGTGLIMLCPCSHVVCLWCTAKELRATHQCPTCGQKTDSCHVHKELYRRYMIDTTVILLEDEEDEEEEEEKEDAQPAPDEAVPTRTSSRRATQPSARRLRYQRRSYAQLLAESEIL